MSLECGIIALTLVKLASKLPSKLDKLYSITLKHGGRGYTVKLYNQMTPKHLKSKKEGIKVDFKIKEINES